MKNDLNRREKGRIYEQRAAEYLKNLGYQIIGRNFYTYFGEIDLIAKKGNLLVFVEVKYRKNPNMGYPQEAVDRKKQQKIIKTAEYYLYKKRFRGMNYRFDVIAILGEELMHIENAFGQ